MTESQSKWIQFATFFHALSSGCLMREYTSRFELYKLLSVPDLPTLHRCIDSRWIMVEHIYYFVKKREFAMIHTTNFIALSLDEISIIDNTTMIIIHAYMLSDWIC